MQLIMDSSGRMSGIGHHVVVTMITLSRCVPLRECALERSGQYKQVWEGRPPQTPNPKSDQVILRAEPAYDWGSLMKMMWAMVCPRHAIVWSLSDGMG